MAGGSVAEQVAILAGPLCSQQGLELVDVGYRKEGADFVLRVLIDKPGGVSLDDCQSLSRVLEGVLDAAGTVNNRYLLEISSAGLDRPLKSDRDFERFTGRLVAVHTFAPVEGQKKFRGTLRGLSEGRVLVEDAQAGVVKAVPRDLIAKAHLEIDVDF